MSEVFHIVPATGRWTWVILIALLAIVLVGGLTMLGLSMRGSKHTTFEVSPSGLRLKGDLYGRRLAASQLRGGAARVVDLDREQSLRPQRRTMGTAVPGYRSGWFRLVNGEKALLYLTNTQRAVYVPTLAGYSLLLSVDRPQEFIGKLREVAPRS